MFRPVLVFYIYNVVPGTLFLMYSWQGGKISMKYQLEKLEVVSE